MNVSAKLLIPVCLALTACSASSEGEMQAAIDTAAIKPPPEFPTDADILSKVYDPTYSVPEDFFVDERAATSGSYTIHHVKDASDSYELCTDDYSTAFDWEIADNANRSVNGYFVGAHETDRYFEIVRELSYDDDVGNIDNLTTPGFARIFKCSNTNRDGVDRTLVNGYAGRLNMRPLTAEQVSTFAEYLWQFTYFPVSSKKVLDSYAEPTTVGFRHTLLIAFRINQGFDNCDLIEVARWGFDVDRNSGVVGKEFATVYSLQARVDTSGTPAVCAN